MKSQISSDKAVSTWQALRYAGPCLLTWSIYFLAFFPGMMSRDSLDQWIEVLKFKFDDWHPAFDSYLYWVLTRIWFSPAIICIAQILALASVFAYGMINLERRGLPRWALITLTLVFSLLPINGFYVNTLFKDVPFGIAVFVLFLYMVEIVESSGKWLGTTKNIAWLAVVMALVWLFRHNGLITVIATFACLLLSYRHYVKNLLVAVLGCALLVYAVKGPLYRAIGVNGRSYALEILLSHQIGAVIYAGTQPTANEQKVLRQVLPLELWRKKYNPFESDSIVFDKHFSYAYLASSENRKKFIATWFSLVRRNVPALLVHQVNVSELIWRFDNQPGSYTYAVHPLIDKNPLGLKTASLLPRVHAFLGRATSITVHRLSFTRVVLFRPALYIYSSLLFVILTSWRLRKKKYLLVAVPLASVVIGILLTIPAQHVRYLYPCFLIAPFLGAYYILHRVVRQEYIA